MEDKKMPEEQINQEQEKTAIQEETEEYSGIKITVVPLKGYRVFKNIEHGYLEEVCHVTF